MPLNPQQQKAVEHGEGPLMIIAGAGTGKTTVITQRYLHLLKEFHLKTENLLCLTFTEKGAAEMEERIEKELPESHSPLWIHTFHGFAERILRIYGHEVGLPKKSKLLTERGERFLFMKDRLEEFTLNFYKPIHNPTACIDDLLRFFDSCKTENIDPQKYLEVLKQKKNDLEAQKYELIGDELEGGLEAIEKQVEVVNAYMKYNGLLRREGLWDFGDMVMFLYELLKTRKSVLLELQKQFKFILVDEYQDTNTLQNEILKLLAGVKFQEETINDKRSTNITVVGDDDQSIFRFQGASIKNILDFTETFSNSQEVVLVENYRSTQPILDAAYAFIQNNNPYRLEVRQNIDKKLKGNTQATATKPQLFVCDTIEDEVGSIVQEIQKLVGSGAYTYQDIALLYRNHDFADPLIEGLKHSNIPFHVVEGSGLYKREEVRDLFSFLRALANPNDSIALFRVMTLEWFGIDPFALLRISNFSKDANKSIMEVLLEDLDAVFASEKKEPDGTLFTQFGNPHLEAIRSFLKIFQEITSLQFKNSASQLIQIIFEKTGWMEFLNQEKTLEDIQKRANLLKVLKKAIHFEYEHEATTIQYFVNYIDSLIEGGDNPEQANYQENPDAVTLITVHKSKGLEWPVVFMSHLGARKFPSDNRKQSIPIVPEMLGDNEPVDRDIHIQEERRLFYVGLTRAKEKLYLSYSKKYGGTRETKASQFVDELLSAQVLDVHTVQTTGFVLEKHGVTEFPKDLKVLPSMKLPVINKTLNLNHSGISAFRGCPLRYKYSNIIQIPRPQSAAPQFGTMIHETLEQFYRRYKEGEIVTAETLLSYYKEHWKRFGYISKEQEKNYFEKGIAILQSYWEVNSKHLTKPIYLEKGFGLKMGTYNVTGKIDRIDRIRDDEVEVVDYKTGRPKTQKEVEKDDEVRLQLYIYAIACQDFLNVNATKLTFYYLEDQSKVTLVPEPEDLAWAENIIVETAGQILESTFEGTPGKVCEWCDFESICPSRAKR